MYVCQVAISLLLLGAANFSERRKVEVRLRRINLPRTPVHKEKKKEGQESSFSPGPSQGRRYVLLLSPHLLTLKIQV